MFSPKTVKNNVAKILATISQKTLDFISALGYNYIE